MGDWCDWFRGGVVSAVPVAWDADRRDACDRCEDRKLSNDEMGWYTIDPDAFSVVPGCRWDRMVVWPLKKGACVAGGDQSRTATHRQVSTTRSLTL